jgi:[acyl-carrier-protein] S-malonyltransferase
MSKKIAFLFPGQGSQFLGMGLDIADRFPKAKEIFEKADRICGKDITRLCTEGPLEELTLTVNLQPAITTVNLACLAALNESGLKPSVSAGHSLGEYGALCATGVLTAEDTLKVVNKRGELMHRESLSHPGVMAAIMGMKIEQVSQIVDQVKGQGILAVANHNTAEQIVITGENEALESAVKRVQEMGGKAIPLKVSGAWHCDLMAGAVEEFRRFMDEIPFSEPQTEVLFNATAESEDNPETIKDIMARQ